MIFCKTCGDESYTNVYPTPKKSQFKKMNILVVLKIFIKVTFYLDKLHLAVCLDFNDIPCFCSRV